MKLFIVTGLLLSSFASFAQNAGTGPGNGTFEEPLQIQVTEEGTYRAVVSGSASSGLYFPVASEILLQKRAEKEAKRTVESKAQQFCADEMGTLNSKVKVKSLESKVTTLGGDNGLVLQCGTYGDGPTQCSGRILVEFVCE